MRSLKIPKMVAAASALGLVVALSACGGGGGGSDTSMMMPSNPALSFAGLVASTEQTEISAGTYDLTGLPASVIAEAAAITPPADGYAPGDRITLGALDLTCGGTDNCTVMVTLEGDVVTVVTTGTIVARPAIVRIAAELAEANADYQTAVMDAEAAAIAAEAAKVAALEAAAMEAETAKQAALDAAAMAAETAKQEALDAAAMAAETAKQAALDAAAMAAETAKQEALDAAAMAAETAKQEALDAAALAAAGMAEADKQAALEAAKLAADAAQAEALRLAGIAADEAQTEALRLAGVAADEAQTEALRLAGVAADEAQTEALRLAGVAADEAQTEALRLAGVAADEAQTEALRLAGIAADAKLKAANDGLVAALLELELEPASDTMSVEYQIAANTATLKGALASIREEAKIALNKAARAERIAREVVVNAAIRANPSAVKALPTGISVQAVTRDAAGKLTVDVNGAADDDYAGGETTAGSGDWNSVTLMKTDANEATDTVVFYTDIAEPADKLLTAEYIQTELDNALDAERVAKAASAGFPSDPDTDWEYTGATDGRAKTVTGTFDGAPGQFTCTAETCEVMTDAEGKLEPSAGWRFTPKSPLTATVKDPDEDYAYFGWWLNKPKLNTAVHDVEVFAGGTTDHEAEVNNAVVGNATYTGPAAGKYVTKTFTAGAQTDAGVGHFTATASLTAKFGTADAPGSIGGMVNGFRLDTGSTPAWAVTLEDASLLDNTETFAGTTEVDFGGGATAMENGGAGTWQGSFYGAGAEDADAPSTVAGTFDAVTEGASVIGGFGATKQ